MLLYQHSNLSITAYSSSQFKTPQISSKILSVIHVFETFFLSVWNRSEKLLSPVFDIYTTTNSKYDTYGQYILCSTKI